MKSIVLHIGIPKTGSSALQVFLAQNRAAHIAQSMDYFSIGEFELGQRGKISTGNGAHIARSLFRPQAAAFRPNRDEQLAALDRQISSSSCDTGLISSELFVFADDAGLSYFRDWLSARNIVLRFVYLIRNQVPFLASSYIQQVKHHACTETCEEYILRMYKKIQHIKYPKLFERLAKIAGPTQIVCLNYDEMRAIENGIFDGFVTSLGLNSRGLGFLQHEVNVSLNVPEIKIMLLLNGLKPRMMFSDYIVENAVRRGRKTANMVRQLLSRETIGQVESYFAEGNTRFARSHFGREALFDNSRAYLDDSPNTASAEPTVSDIVETLGGLIVRLDERLAQIERGKNTSPPAKE
jgi:hypothetical protein